MKEHIIKKIIACLGIDHKCYNRLVNYILRAYEEPTIMLIEGPTGIGKTTSLVVGSLIYTASAILEGKISRRTLFCVKAYPLLNKVLSMFTHYINQLKKECVSSKLRVVAFKGKEKCCPYSLSDSIHGSVYALCESLLFNRKCIFYTNLISNFSDALKITYEFYDCHLEEKLIESNLCPYYLTKALLSDANIILTTYYNLFNAHLVNELEFPVVIVDEVHNLPLYIFDQFTIAFNLTNVKQELRSLLPSHILDKVFIHLAEVEDRRPHLLSKLIDLDSIYNAYHLIRDKVIWSLEEVDVQRELYQRYLYFFNYLVSHYGELIFIKNKEDCVITLDRIFYKASEHFKNTYSFIGTSATLHPVQHYVRLLFADANKRIVILRYKRYPINQLPKICPVYHEGFTSLYKRRTISLIESVAEKVLEITKEGQRTVVFVASKELGSMIEAEIKRKFKNVKVSNLDYQQLNTLDEGSSIIIVSQRGRYSEGVDINADNIVIFGFSLAPYTVYQYAYMMALPYNKLSEKYKFGYILPAVIALVQSIGRVLRPTKKHVTLHVLEDRLHRKYIVDLLPKWMSETLTGVNR
ncbi:MAG: helicase C-terminal domain-containing protein [Candidatus Geothermarchaeota archaeon]